MILSAKRIDKKDLPKPRTTVARSGLSFQRKFSRELQFGAPKSFTFETDAWFEYRHRMVTTPLFCSPDLLAIDNEEKFILIVEVKQTWTPLAIQKLRDVYCPVVQKALNLPCRPLVAAKILIPSAPRPQPTLSFALLSDDPLIHWTGRGPILW